MRVDSTQISVSLKKQIFLNVLMISIIAVFVLSIFDFYFLKNSTMAIVDVIDIVLFASFYFLARYRDSTDRLILPFILIFMISVNLGWYEYGGLLLPIALFFMILMYISIVIAPKGTLDLIIILILLNMIVLAVLEFINPEFRKVVEAEVISMLFFNFFIYVSLMMCTFLLAYVKNQYDWAREQLYRQNLELDEQSEELTTLNNKLKVLNQELEGEVESRTKKLVEKNKKLIDYALKNSHNVRGPLSRIIGLAALIEKGVLEEEDRLQSMKYIELSIEELESEISKVNEQLEEELF